MATPELARKLMKGNWRALQERAENIEVLTLDKKLISDETCAAWQEERKYLDQSYVKRALTRDAFAIDSDGKVVFLYLKNIVSAQLQADALKGVLAMKMYYAANSQRSLTGRRSPSERTPVRLA
jgi:hypothetical protein